MLDDKIRRFLLRPLERHDLIAFPRLLPSNNWPGLARRAYTRGFAWLRDRLL
jgi:hypothetical protein